MDFCLDCNKEITDYDSAKYVKANRFEMGYLCATCSCETSTVILDTDLSEDY